MALFCRCFAVVLIVTHVCLSDGRSVHTRSDDVTPLEEVVMRQGQLITQMQAEIAALKTQSAKDPLVAFMAYFPKSQDLSHNPRIHYGTPVLSIGGGFHSSTDSFVAPVSGLYVFFLKVSAASHVYTNYMLFGLKKEGTVIAETETNDDDNVDRSSVQVIVQLREGESVWVEKLGGGGTTIVGGGVASSLGGFLLRAEESF